ncbi:MAG: nucleoside triphosphate pyrophosphohydrolase [Pseudomonadota bacterium]
MKEFEKLVEIMAALRDPQSGCPWDVEQDFASIAPYTIEEAYEVADVIQREAWDELPDELGDLLLQVVFHAQMADERGWFNVDDVAAAINAKMIRRHPHVFSDEARGDAQAQLARWDQMKADEKRESADSQSSILDAVTVGLPALQRAQKLGKKAAKAGFDWPNAHQVRDQIDLELSELDAELDVDLGEQASATRVAQELGDVLFSVVQLARHLDVDAAEALRMANFRFVTRFQQMEQQARSQGDALEAWSADEWERAWRRAKQATE